MTSMIGHILFGLVVGVVAKFIFPGHDPGGIIVTILLGMAGAWLGGLIGRALGWYPEGHSAGFLMALVGALILLLGYHLIFGRSAGTASVAPSRIAITASMATAHHAPDLAHRT